MLEKWWSYWDSLVKLVFPELCIACQQEQPVKGDIFCVGCEMSMPYCKFPNLEDNLIHWRIGGRFLPEWASSYLYFKSGTSSQHILHALKYRGRQDIGELLGLRHGKEIKNLLTVPPPDVLIPVPLHPRKQHQRGYNQSAAYGRGLADALDVRMRQDLLVRGRYTETQTNKSKEARINNVLGAFTLSDPGTLEGKSVLLVDDVFTSGATLEACALPLLAVPGIKLAVATLAIADDW